MNMNLFTLVFLILSASLSSPARGVQLPCEQVRLLGFDEILELPTRADDPALSADHATIALNDSGCALVVWNYGIGKETSGGAPRKGIEGALARRLPNGMWQYPGGTNHPDSLLLADPDLNSIFGGDDSCNKPDVVAVGDDFLVTWSRFDPDHPRAAGCLEAVLLVVAPSDGVQIFGEAGTSNPLVLDSTVMRGDAGVVPDAVHDDIADEIYVVYSHEVAVNGKHHDFEIRMARVDRSLGPSGLVASWRSLDFPLVAFDRPSSGAVSSKAKILPDVVALASGVAISYEERRDRSPTVESIIHLRVLSLTPQAVGFSFTELASTELVSPSPTRALRRPMLSSLRPTPSSTLGDQLTVAWIEADDLTFANTDIGYFSLQYEGPTYPSFSLLGSANLYKNLPQNDDAFPVPFRSLLRGGTTGIVFREKQAGLESISCSIAPLGLPTQFASWPGYEVTRPALGINDSAGMEFLAFSFEGRPIGSPGYRIYAGFCRLATL